MRNAYAIARPIRLYSGDPNSAILAELFQEHESYFPNETLR